MVNSIAFTKVILAIVIAAFIAAGVFVYIEIQRFRGKSDNRTSKYDGPDIEDFYDNE